MEVLCFLGQEADGRPLGQHTLSQCDQVIALYGMTNAEAVQRIVSHAPHILVDLTVPPSPTSLNSLHHHLFFLFRERVTMVSVRIWCA